MTCEMCGKEEATVYYTEIVGGKMVELHLCEQCAKKKGLGKELAKSTFSLADLLAGMAEELGDAEEDKDLRCASCGLSYGEFKKAGKLGCASCYQVFRQNLLPLLRRIHGSTHHSGKIISGGKGDLQTKREIADLRKELRRAIDREAFEDAARLRDKIDEREKKLSEETTSGSS